LTIIAWAFNSSGDGIGGSFWASAIMASDIADVRRAASSSS
jgi:hypothetical protein